MKWDGYMANGDLGIDSHNATEKSPESDIHPISNNAVKHSTPQPSFQLISTSQLQYEFKSFFVKASNL